MKKMVVKRWKLIVVVLCLVLFCVVAKAIDNTYAYENSDCPSGYTLKAGTNQCVGKPVYNCASGGTYDSATGYCLYSQSCPTGYSLTDDNHCVKEINRDYSCSLGDYDSASGYCLYQQSCPTGYRLSPDGGNYCIKEPTIEYNCTYGTYDSDEGYCVYYKTCPSGYTLNEDKICVGPSGQDFSCVDGAQYDISEGYCIYYMGPPTGYKIVDTYENTITYHKEPEIEQICENGGTYDNDGGYCNYYLTTPDGYSVFNVVGTTITYNKLPSVNVSCDSGGTSDGSNCNYYLTTPTGYSVFNRTSTTMTYSAESTWHCPIGVYNYGDSMCYYSLPVEDDSNTDNNTGSGDGDDNEENNNPSEEVKKYKVSFELAEQDGLQNVVLLKNDTILDSYVIDNIESNLFNVSEYSASSDNYEFTHWSSGDCGDSNSILTGTITLKDDITNVYACWNEKETSDEKKEFDVIFNLDGGTLYLDENKTEIVTYTLSKIDLSRYKAKKDNYEFIGWSKDSQNCVDVVVDDVKLITDDVNLYACYRIIKEDVIVENPKTGKKSLYLVVLIGVFSLGGAIYYSYRMRKKSD